MQTSYTQDPAVAYAGMPADDGFKDDLSTVVADTAGIDPGLVVVRGLEGDKTSRLIPAVAADVDGIIATPVAASAGAPVVVAAGDPEVDGALGAGPYILPKKITVALNSHANWDASTGSITYEDQDGVQQTEALAIPDAGNVTLTTTGFARRFVSITIPIQAGTAATFTMGVSAAASVGGGDVLGVSVRTHKARSDFSASDAQKYLDEEVMPVRRKGRVWVTVENAFEAGDMPLVRGIAAGAEKLGAIRVGDTDSGDCFPWTRARLLTSGSAGALGLLEINVL
jgi:hypothetical protein